MTNQKKVQTALILRINELCKQREMSYYSLSYKSSMTLTTLMHIIDGTSKNPGVFTIAKICDGFGMTLQEFFDTKAFEEGIIELRDEN